MHVGRYVLYLCHVSASCKHVNQNIINANIYVYVHVNL